MNEFEKLMEAGMMIGELKAKTNEMPYEVFIPFVCMLMEEYCFANGKDMVEVTKEMADLVVEIDTTEGKYKGGQH